MKLVAITRHGHTATVEFAYDAELLAIIRNVPGRHWVANRKRWTVPAEQINGCAALFHEAGCTVTVDGAVWTPPAQHSGSVPSSRVELLNRMFEAIPDRLVSPTHRALIRVWHPDTGGDHALAQDLNQVWSRSPKGTR